MKISLIIPAHNEEAYIGECLKSVMRNGKGLFEVLVVNNASTDKTEEVARAFSGVRVVVERRKGLTKARQRGLEESTGDLIAYIDADTRLPEGWVEKVNRIFSERKDAVALSGPARYYDATSPLKRFILDHMWWVSAPLTYQLVGYMLYGANFVAKRSALLAIGGFDTNISFYGEDTDIARRLSTQGKVLFRMNFYILGSARRFQTEGIVMTNIRYTLNYFWPVLFGRPFTRNYRDVRQNGEKKSS